MWTKLQRFLIGLLVLPLRYDHERGAINQGTIYSDYSAIC
jgi:hypothetical protein